MKKLKGIGLSMATALIVTTAFSAPAMAQPAGFSAGSSNAISALSSADNTPSGTEDEQCKEFEASNEAVHTTSGAGSAELQSVQQAVADNQIRLQADDEQVRWEKSELISFAEEDERIVAAPISIPDKGRSTLVATLDAEGSIISYSETHIQSISDKEAHVSKWSDGNLETDQTYNANDPQLQRGVGEIYQRLNDCLGAHGVPVFLAGIIVGACSLAGGVAGLTACLVGYGLFSGTAGWCAGYAIRGTGNEYA
ncbi:hypothetical protein [Corynebacterium cystitidis]|uniref:hypothetical protein n=1 Tax=Corynebacterium cystitidis TaxID=35757 RepID=UPI00211EDA26|nr:hypothetical protein [Corynebacterium cystitidis]